MVLSFNDGDYNYIYHFYKNGTVKYKLGRDPYEDGELFFSSKLPNVVIAKHKIIEGRLKGRYQVIKKFIIKKDDTICLVHGIDLYGFGDSCAKNVK